MTLKDQLSFIHEGAAVQRFHARPGLAVDTDASHQYMVAMLVYLLCDGAPTVQLLMAALTHDLAEQYTGDLPAPVKWAVGSDAIDALERSVLERYGMNFELAEEDAALLKAADWLAGMLHCCREAALGNRTVWLIYDKWEARVRTQFAVGTDRWKVYEAVTQIWKESNSETGPKFDVYKER